MFQYSFTERTVPVPVSVRGKTVPAVPVPRSVPAKTVPTVPVPVRFLGHPVISETIVHLFFW